jgi:hypothetical protein
MDQTVARVVRARVVVVVMGSLHHPCRPVHCWHHQGCLHCQHALAHE